MIRARRRPSAADVLLEQFRAVEDDPGVVSAVAALRAPIRWRPLHERRRLLMEIETPNSGLEPAWADGTTISFEPALAPEMLRGGSELWGPLGDGLITVRARTADLLDALGVWAALARALASVSGGAGPSAGGALMALYNPPPLELSRAKGFPEFLRAGEDQEFLLAVVLVGVAEPRRHSLVDEWVRRAAGGEAYGRLERFLRHLTDLAAGDSGSATS